MFFCEQLLFNVGHFFQKSIHVVLLVVALRLLGGQLQLAVTLAVQFYSLGDLFGSTDLLLLSQVTLVQFLVLGRQHLGLLIAFSHVSQPVRGIHSSHL